MRKDNSEFKTAFLSEAGTFINNKDYFAFIELDDIACWVVAHGLDSDREVESAEMAVRSILGNFINNPTMSRMKIKKYMQEAHKLLQEESHRVRLKASLALVVTNYTKMIWAVAGNAKLYHFRNGRLNFKSKDQSLAQLMADEEEIPESQIEEHEERNNLLNYLGKPYDFKPIVSKKYQLTDGDVMVLGTPGLSEGVNSVEMLDTIREAKEPEDAVDTLEDVLLSKQRPIVNNYTAATIFVNKTYKEDPKKKIRIIKRIVVALVIFALIGGGAIVYKVRTAAKTAESVASMIEQEKNGDAFIQDGDYPKALKEYSEARNAAVRIKDAVHMKLIGKKYRITQLIVDGDTAFKDGDYAKALSKYEKAQKEVQGRKDFNVKEVDGKVNTSKSLIQISNWMKEGDLKFEKQDYAGAKSTYEKARKAAIAASFTDGEKEIKAKLDETEEKMSTIEKEKRQLDGEKLEKKGDKSYASQDFKKAIESYATAQEVYQEIGMLEKVLSMERKITKAEEKLNPIPKEGAEANAGAQPNGPAASGNADQAAEKGGK
ncbi:PP2C family protein-serine/threonine phosphatase [Aneurinibacillus aneurinilyticus]|uniref:Serine/threonine protein phosphatase n=2 Tax=Aneurinibacillus aneurinilyticus TaxID=1391 RepID=A0A848CPD0_ANEAE|nr:PP2C family serine/threonine-protein phosphatase [Aneurinibacillus aneurinilyticus]ERI04673.1 tetratricopeptide repeat protein [Aneurinibacillus aneurinilyticus ATCC 12856]MED0706039.1 PP2C family serine/threonine-protein phosphatase [Aneurinibacillus aneurinilyticus]MED0724870.1 PP2C family serine/threonine-protein phosphatase [Aneurinibacillus aneurinilyticus]MED0730837.1 PP2C family serine/threonine-protein phosphatase [Aneurinibacillus aneurinilyticus]MED0743614.1 PP2C family serine/thr